MALASEGTVGTKVAAAVDFMSQRLLDPRGAAQAKASGELRARIVAVVTELGDKAVSQNAIAFEVEGVDTKRVHAEIKAMLADGALTRDGKVIRPT